MDVFTEQVFKGNPAAVCVMDKWPKDEFMIGMSVENNLSETAFAVKEEGNRYHLRWFTPGGEIELCGHATLASAAHLFGCDGYGRDILARVIHGGKTSLGIAILATITSCIFGSLLGAVAGFFGGKVDALIMRALDIFMSVPDILFTMAVVYALGANFINLMVALTLTFFTNYVRLVRSQVLTLSEQDYVEAARAGGAGGLRIILSHVLPNSVGVIIVNSTLNVAKIVIYESTLSFLGLGMPQPAPEWGQMLSEAREFMSTAPHLLLFPALAIVLTACAINLVGDGMRDALDPHLKS